MLATHLVILLFILNCRVRHYVKCRLFQISKMLALPIALQKKKKILSGKCLSGCSCPCKQMIKFIILMENSHCEIFFELIKHQRFCGFPGGFSSSKRFDETFLKKRRHMASEHRHQTDAKSGQNHLAVPNSVFDDASQSAVLLLILCLVSVQLMSELFWTF